MQGDPQIDETPPDGYEGVYLYKNMIKSSCPHRHLFYLSGQMAIRQAEFSWNGGSSHSRGHHTRFSRLSSLVS